MTDRKQIEKITKLLNELDLADLTLQEFNDGFTKLTIDELRDESWRLYCFANDVCDTLNMGDTVQEPCEDCISREAVLEYIDKMPSELTADGRRMIRRRTLEEYISDTLPPVDLQPKTGHWTRRLIRNEKGGCIGAKMICSGCGNDNKHDEHMNYCPNCGAKMQEVKE